MIRPFMVVRSTKVGVDFNELAQKPGDYGLICPNDFKPGWFNVHWPEEYTCTVGPGDVEIIPEEQVARIIGGGGSCGYCGRLPRRAK